MLELTTLTGTKFLLRMSEVGCVFPRMAGGCNIYVRGSHGSDPDYTVAETYEQLKVTMDRFAFGNS